MPFRLHKVYYQNCTILSLEKAIWKLKISRSLFSRYIYLKNNEYLL